MSYLDVPRLHFSGDFFSDPSTVNNDPSNYTPGALLAPGDHPMGTHQFELRGCAVRRVVERGGAIKSTAAGDALVGAAVALSGRIVDLHPRCQQTSEIFGASLRLSLADGATLAGTLARMSLRELWPGRGGGDEGMGGVFYTTVGSLAWTGTSTSPVLAELRAGAHAGLLSLKLVVFAYEQRTGQVVGSLGIHQDGDEPHYLGARRLEDGAGYFEVNLAASVPDVPEFGCVPCKLDRERRRLIVDLGNALRDADRASGALGRVHVAYRDDAGALVYLGKRIPHDTAHYLESAGVEEVALTRSETSEAERRSLVLKVDRPRVRVVLNEPRIHLDVEQVVHRLDAGDSTSTRIGTRRRGEPLAGQKVEFKLLEGTPAAALSFPATLTSDASGHLTLPLTAGDPGTPEPGLDGALYAVGCFWADRGKPSLLRAVLHVRVFSRFVAPATPTWSDVQPIFSQYARLYPSMTAVIDLSDEKKVRGAASALAAAMRRPFDSAQFMPLSRDLSASKTRMILSWLDAVTRNPRTP